MTEKQPVLEMRPEGLAVRRTWRNWTRSKWRRIFQWGCLPVLVLLMFLTVTAITLLTYNQVGGWYANPRAIQIRGRLNVAFWLILAGQWVFGWAMGQFGAGRGGRAAFEGAAGSMPLRLKVLRKRWRALPITLLVLRIGLIGVAVMFALYAGTRLLGEWIYFDFIAQMRYVFARVYSNGWATVLSGMVVVMGLLLVFQLLAGPFFHLRYTLALGSLGGSLTRERAARQSAGLSLHLGLNLLIAVLPLWLFTAGVMIYTSVTGSFFYDANDLDLLTSSYLPNLIPDYVQQYVIGLVSAALLLLFYTLGQVFLPGLYVRLAQRRLRRRAQQLKKENGE